MLVIKEVFNCDIKFGLCPLFDSVDPDQLASWVSDIASLSGSTAEESVLTSQIFMCKQPIKSSVQVRPIRKLSVFQVTGLVSKF